MREIAEEHTAALSSVLSNMEHTLSPVLVRMGAASGSDSAHASASWQAAAEEVLHSSHRVDAASSLLLGVAPGDNAKSDLPSELLRSVKDEPAIIVPSGSCTSMVQHYLPGLFEGTRERGATA